MNQTKNINTPLFSVLTPTWNRESYLPNVWHSLKIQEYHNFEWIVADDGSEDGTRKMVLDLASKCSFPVVYIRADRHVGKTRVDNEAIIAASGDFILWCDSDDQLMPKALNSIFETIASKAFSRKELCNIIVGYAVYNDGITLCSNLNSLLDNSRTYNENQSLTLNIMTETHGIQGDFFICARASLLKANLFPEVDLYMPEGLLWATIGEYPVDFIPEILIHKNYNSKGAISFVKTMTYCRGKAYSLSGYVSRTKGYERPFILRVWQLVTFIRYSIHGEIDTLEARRLWSNNPAAEFYWVLFLVGLMLALRDKFKQVVVYSHREFLRAREGARVSVERLNSNHADRSRPYHSINTFAEGDS